jgi:predicted PurR-regulated permease PerM
MAVEWRTGTRYLVGVGLVLVLAGLLYISRPILPELVLASLVAFLVRPVIDFFRRRLRFPTAGAVALTYVLVGIGLLVVPLVFLPHIITAVNFLASIDLRSVIDNVMRWLIETLTVWQVSGLHILGFVIPMRDAVGPVLEALKNPGASLPTSFSSITTILSSLLSFVSRGAAGVVGTVAGSFLSLAFTLLASIYLSVDGPKMMRSVHDLVPEPYRPEVLELVDRLRRVWDAFVRGQLLLMVIIGTVVGVGAAILGLPNALSLGVLAGFLELVPSLGPFLATVPAVLIALLQGSNHFAIANGWFALIVLAFYVGVQSLENTFIVPRVLGDAVKVHPLVILAGVLVGAATAGVLGVFLAAPIIASLREVLGYLYRKVMNVEPFPPEEPPAPRTPPRPWRERLPGFLRRRGYVREGTTLAGIEGQPMPPGPAVLPGRKIAATTRKVRRRRKKSPV